MMFAGDNELQMEEQQKNSNFIRTHNMLDYQNWSLILYVWFCLTFLFRNIPKNPALNSLQMKVISPFCVEFEP